MRSWRTISPFAGAAVLPRLALLMLIILILGVPINDFWRFLLLTMAVMVVCFGHVRLEPLRWLVVLSIALTVVIVDWLLPGPRIEEGHNVYIPWAPASRRSREICRQMPIGPCWKFSTEPI